MYTLDERDAFKVMTRFLAKFYDETGGDFSTLLTDIEMEPDGVTTDPAAWYDWVEFVKQIKGIPNDPKWSSSVSA